MLSKHEEQQERLDVLKNEQRLRNQGSTFSEFAQSDAATSRGRYGAISSPQVVGQQAIPNYPAAFLQHDPVPDEPSLGVNINEMPVCGEPHEQSPPKPSPCSEALAPDEPTSDAPPLVTSSHVVERGVGSSPSSRGQRRSWSKPIRPAKL